MAYELLGLGDVEVGDVLYYRNVNEHHGAHRSPEEREQWTPPTVEINKAGPKRVGFLQYGRQKYASRQTRAVDDWTWLETMEQHEEAARRLAMIRQLAEAGVTLSRATLDTALIVRLVAALEPEEGVAVCGLCGRGDSHDHDADEYGVFEVDEDRPRGAV